MSEEEKRPCESVPSCRAQRAAGEMRAELGRDGLPTSRLHASPRKERTDGQTASRSGHDRTKLSSLRVTDEDGVRFPFAGVAPPPASPSSPSPAAAPRVPLRPGRGGSDSSFPPARRTPVSQRSLDSPLGPASRPRSPRGCFDPYDSPEDRDKEYVGFAALPNQVHRKAVKKGFAFTPMVAGESGLGKSTLINGLFLTDLYKDRKIPNAEAGSIWRTTWSSSSIGSSGTRAASTAGTSETTACTAASTSSRLTDTGPRGAASLRDQHLPLRRPRLGRRRRRLREARPAAQGSRASRPNNARRVRRVTVAVQDSVPFAVIGSNVLAESRGRRVKGRTYPWGVAEVESAAHSDFLLLRDMLVRTHMRDLKDVTRESHYENYRARCIRNMTRMVARDPKRSLRAKCREESDADVPLPLAAFDADKDRLASEKDREIGGPATRTRVRRSRRVVAHLVPVVCAAQGDDAGGDAERPRVRPRQHRRGNNVPVSVGFLFAHASACPPCHFELHLFVIHCHCFYCHLVADDNQEQSNKNC
ncbi:septin-4-like isoform X6 [Phycodurus eques]|uniref:septin-4-like isoform X6 n=1 Tax=Phycodurus eques TaxID=693459 RepID=UPI002ACDBEE0|nr:septin-4-like isoform X6 [Phycodurus eques]